MPPVCSMFSSKLRSSKKHKYHKHHLIITNDSCARGDGAERRNRAGQHASNIWIIKLHPAVKKEFQSPTPNITKTRDKYIIVWCNAGCPDWILHITPADAIPGPERSGVSHANMRLQIVTLPLSSQINGGEGAWGWTVTKPFITDSSLRRQKVTTTRYVTTDGTGWKTKKQRQRAGSDSGSVFGINKEWIIKWKAAVYEE